MTVKPNNWYIGKVTGEFFLKNIANVNGVPVFEIETVGGTSINLSLEEMREDKPKALK